MSTLPITLNVEDVCGPNLVPMTRLAPAGYTYAVHDGTSDWMSVSEDVKTFISYTDTSNLCQL
mgnify:FL=1